MAANMTSITPSGRRGAQVVLRCSLCAMPCL